MRRLAVLVVVISSLLTGLTFAPRADASTITAKSLLSKLPVRAESGSSSYARSQFRYPIDADADTCDTREEVLIQESRVPVRRATACRVVSGRWLSPYDGRTWTRRGDVSVEHLVPLKEAWESGAHRWIALDRQRFANDIRYRWSLNVVTDDLKSTKGSRDPAQWLPPRAKCSYAIRWVAVKYRWRLSINRGEKAALGNFLNGSCGGTRLSAPGRARLAAPASVTDTTAPGASSGLAATVSGSSVALTWRAAADDVGVRHYDVHRSRLATFSPGATTRIGSTTSTSYRDAARPAGTGYYRVVAVDASGKVGPPSATAAAVVAAPEATTLFAVGDIACRPGSLVTSNTCRHGEVAKVISAAPSAYFTALGDLQYRNGTYAEFTGAGGYHATFGHLRARTFPVIGNHEQTDPTALNRGYFDYFYGAGVANGPFGTRPHGYYTATIGGWQFIALNSECLPDLANGGKVVPGGCGVGSPQYRWLESVLASSTARCTVVASHRPRWTTGGHESYPALGAMWDLMARNGVDVAVAGHNHSSEVFRPIGVSAGSSVPTINTAGIKSFVAGAGGKGFGRFRDSSSAVWRAVQARDNTTFGPLRLTLKDGAFDWRYVPIAGQTFKNVGTTGSFAGNDQACH